jgi:hypothetical protein
MSHPESTLVSEKAKDTRWLSLLYSETVHSEKVSHRKSVPSKVGLGESNEHLLHNPDANRDASIFPAISSSSILAITA